MCISKKFKWRFKEISNVFLRIFRGVSRAFQGGLKGVSFNGISRLTSSSQVSLQIVLFLVIFLCFRSKNYNYNYNYNNNYNNNYNDNYNNNYNDNYNW